MTAALGGAGSAAALGLRGLRRRAGSHDEPTPWERMEADAAVVHGVPRPGFDAVLASGGATRIVGQLEREANGPHGRHEYEGRRNDTSGTLPASDAAPGEQPLPAPFAGQRDTSGVFSRIGQNRSPRRSTKLDPTVMNSGGETPRCQRSAIHPIEVLRHPLVHQSPRKVRPPIASRVASLGVSRRHPPTVTKRARRLRPRETQAANWRQRGHNGSPRFRYPITAEVHRYH
jgi:hypothetical protein